MGAISAAFLLALTQQDAKSSDMMRCYTLSVRPQLSLADARWVGLYIYMGMTTHSLQADSMFWDVARRSNLNSQIDICPAVSRGAPTSTTPGEISPMPPLLLKQRNRNIAQLDVTNLGRIDGSAIRQLFG